MILAATAAVLVKLAADLACPEKKTVHWPELGWHRVEGPECPQGAGALACAPDLNIWYPDLTPNDPYSQPVVTPPVNSPNRSLPAIGAFEAWDVVSDASHVRVGVIDTGAQLDHSDLVPNLAGGIDLVFGDFRPEDEWGHGTLTAGEIAAAGNNGKLVAGLAWRVQLLPIRVFPGSGSTSTSRLVSAVAWATANGVHMLNMSLSCLSPRCSSQALFDALAAYPGFVAASAGDNGVDTGVYGGSYPCAYPLPNILCVAASDSEDRPATFTNWGSMVDLAAPGVNVWGPVLGGHTGYGEAPDDAISTLSGTSMSAPLDAGAGVLIKARNPAMTGAQVAQAILGAVDPLPAGVGWETRPIATGGRLNVARALSLRALPPVALRGNNLCGPSESCRSHDSE